jgi:adenylate cyclase
LSSPTERLGTDVRDAPDRRPPDASPRAATTPLGVEEIARRSGTTVERVRELVDLGILVPSGDADRPFRGGDAMRVQLIEELEASGVPAERVAEAISSGALSLSYLDWFPGPSPRSDRSHAQVCEELGIPFELLDRMYAGFGLARPKPDEPVREEDLDILNGLPGFFAAGLGEAEVMRAARVWGEGVRRVAEHQVRAFHEFVEEPFRRQGLSDDQALGAAVSRIGVRLIPYVDRMVSWVYRRHFESYQTEHRLAHIEAALDRAGLHRRPRALAETCAFADLSGYTRLTEELGDTAASGMALKLAEVMQEVAARRRGLVVKMLGDGVHLHFHDPAGAVLGSIELVERARQLELPPARVGVNAGPMTYTDGDYYGLTVIIAARLAGRAGPGEVLVGQVVAERAAPEGVRFEEIGPVPLKGVARPVTVYRAVREDAAAS